MQDPIVVPRSHELSCLEHLTKNVLSCSSESGRSFEDQIIPSAIPQNFQNVLPSQNVDPAVQQWFVTVDRDKSGEINWQELQSALVNGQGQHFSDQACKCMIGMFDRDKTGTINMYEFQALYNYINQWLGVFKMYDRDQSGSIEEQELNQALTQMGFRFSTAFVKSLIVKADLQNHKTMSVDQFMVTCVQIQRFTEAFRVKDTQMTGVITIGFEDYLNIAITCSTL